MAGLRWTQKERPRLLLPQALYALHAVAVLVRPEKRAGKAILRTS